VVDELRRRPRLLAVVLLVAVSAAWGSTFVVMKTAVAHAPVLEFLAWRFLLASAILLALRPRAVLRLGRRGWAQGVGLGGVLAAGYIVQTHGLEDTPAAISGFLTGMQVVFTPLLAWLLLRRRPGSRTWVATTVAALGLAVITLRGLSFGAGETLTIMCAVLFALQIVGVGRWASVKDALGLATVQLLTVGIVCTLGQLPSGIGLPASGEEWWAVVVTAVAATAFAFAVQSWAQSHLSTTATSIVFTLEPVFAALFAWGAGEPIGWSVVVGGGLVVAATLVLGLSPAPSGEVSASRSAERWVRPAVELPMATGAVSVVCHDGGAAEEARARLALAERA
jgi:drug/metabolite transporter (DMT)-like permease